MRKLLALVLKELLIVVRDRTALLLFLAAPLGLTLVLAFASGGMAGGSDLSAIPVAVVNQDSGSVGAALVELLGSDELGGLIAATPASDSQAARNLVDRDEAAAAILIPPDLSSRATQTEGEPARIELYTNPGQPISSAVVQEVVQRFAQQVATGAVAAQVTVRLLLESGLVSADEAETVLPVAAERAAATAVAQQMVELATVSEQGAESGTVVYLAYYAPSFAILFLMFATASAAHTLLTEREAGTLTGLMLPAINATRVARFRTEALLHALRVLNAIQGREQAGEVSEPRLDELGLPAEASLDPVNREPLHVKKTPQGWLIYGVGTNLKDDGGQLKDYLDFGIGPK